KRTERDKEKKHNHEDILSIYVDNENHDMINRISDYIDLTEIDDPHIRDSVKNKVFHLVKKLEAEKYESIMQIINLKDDDKVLVVKKILKTFEAEKLEIIKNEEKEKQSIIEMKESDIIERIMKTSKLEN
ncbi:28087_t:CDS:1, partial [Gigaspora margarita]